MKFRLCARGLRAAVVPFFIGSLPAAGVFAAEPPLRPVAPRDVDAIFALWDKPRSPGVALAVIHNGAIVYERGYGRADLEHDIPITPETVFYIGSVSKQFAAAAIALLAQRGTLSLDDDVRKFVPELPDYGATITVRHLIHHTSGLRDYLALRDIAGEPGDGTFGDDYVLALLRRQKALNFAPGTQHLYSNSGYFLLSVIVKRTTGKSLREFAADAFFTPLEMRTALFRDDHRFELKNRANGYAPSPATADGYGISNPNFDVVGAGGVFMTVRDFLAWDRNFYDAKIGGTDLIAQLQTPGKLNDGSPLTYAFGLNIGRFRGLRVVEHSGSYGGFRAHAVRFPDQRFSVVCFTNLSTMVPSRLSREVAALYLDEQMSAETSPTVAATANSDAAGTTIRESSITKSAPSTASLETLRAFAGTYFSDELNSDCRITLEGETLALQRGERAPLKLRVAPGAAPTFAGGSWKLAFQRHPSGEIASFLLEVDRVRGLVFVRR